MQPNDEKGINIITWSKKFIWIIKIYWELYNSQCYDVDIYILVTLYK